MTKGERARKRERERVLKRKIASLKSHAAKTRVGERSVKKKISALVRERGKIETKLAHLYKLEDNAYRKQLGIVEELRELRHQLEQH
jgi:hypothetical protein